MYTTVIVLASHQTTFPSDSQQYFFKISSSQIKSTKQVQESQLKEKILTNSQC